MDNLELSYKLNRLYSSAIACAHDIEVMDLMYNSSFLINRLHTQMNIPYSNDLSTSIKNEIKRKLDIIDAAMDIMENLIRENEIVGSTYTEIKESIIELVRFSIREKKRHNFEIEEDSESSDNDDDI